VPRGTCRARRKGSAAALRTIIADAITAHRTFGPWPQSGSSDLVAAGRSGDMNAARAKAEAALRAHLVDEQGRLAGRNGPPMNSGAAARLFGRGLDVLTTG
jgi:hypothetical protein